MGYKKVCTNCRKAFNIRLGANIKPSLICPECSGDTIILSHLFRSPKIDDLKKWKVVEFLIDHGFLYQHIYETYTPSNVLSGQLHYPETLKEAKDFVVKYKAQAYKLKWDDEKRQFVRNT
jgi:hypothetical protein